uniref:Uncharacterized protein n=1 Tax=Lepeophtheirus salmonis TaxID=72036 RepID=A0A0K2TI64_LEPSM
MKSKKLRHVHNIPNIQAGFVTRVP